MSGLLGQAERAPALPRRRSVPSRGLLMTLLRIADDSAIALATAAAVYASLESPAWPVEPMAFLLAALTVLMALNATNSYDRAAVFDSNALCLRFAGALIFAGVLLWAGGMLFSLPHRVLVTGTAILAAIGFLGGGARLLLDVKVERLRAAGMLSTVVAVVGTGRAAARYIQRARAEGAEVVGVFVTDSETETTEFEDVPILGRVSDVARHPAAQSVTRVAVALPATQGKDIVSVLNTLRVLPIEIDLVPDFLDIFDQDALGVAAARPLWLLKRPMPGSAALLKLIEDKVLATLLLILLAPVFLVIAVLIRMDSPGPVLFRATRPGFDSDLIRLFKFRTMTTIDRVSASEAQPNDPRITRIGALLRAHRLDELPQIFNVLSGEMSLVGPRPLSDGARLDRGVMGDVLKEYARRRAVKPGMTGWAQVNGGLGPCRTVEEVRRRAELDLYYINNWSLLLDFRILLRTLAVVVKQGDKS